MTIDIESSGTGESTGGTTSTLVINTASANEYIAIGFLAGTPITPLSTVEPHLTITSAGGLTWTPLGNAGGQAFFNSRGFGLTVWTAPAPTALTNATIEVQSDITLDDVASVYVALTGVTAPYLDPNGALPVEIFNTNNTLAAEGTFSTTNAPDMLLAFIGSNENNLEWINPSVPAGSSVVATVENNGGNYFAYLGVMALPLGSPETDLVYGSTYPLTSNWAFVGLAFNGSPAAPGVPTDPVCGGSTTSIITPTWSAPSSGGTPDSYTLQWRQFGTLTWNTITGITIIPQVISGLLDGTQYEWQVQAVNGGGSSAFTAITICVTVSLAPTIPPRPQSLGQYRGQVGINYGGFVLVGDAFAGVIGKMNFNTFTEYGNTMWGQIASPPVHKDRKRVFVKRLELDVESGVGLPVGQGEDPVWMLDWSKDGGRTFSELQTFRSMGRIGEYLTRLRWLRLGQSRQWIFRLQSTDPVRRVIIGTYLDVTEGMG
jgi:hypothetical protein